MDEQGRPGDQVFLSYVHEDSQHVEQLQQMLEAAGIPVWRDKTSLRPGQNWNAHVRQAIVQTAIAFIACFSQRSVGKNNSYQNEELILAIEQLRRRHPDDLWLIPVRFDNCEIPDRDLGGGRRLASIHCADLFGDKYHENARMLVESILAKFDRHPDAVVGAVAIKQAREIANDHQRSVSSATAPLDESEGLKEAVRAEIRRLRKGHGVHGSNLDRLVGPLLKELINQDAHAASVHREALASSISNYANALPDKFRDAIIASLGLSPEMQQMPNLKDRVAWLAAHNRYNPRTALRRIDNAENLIAEGIAQELNHRRTWRVDWYLDELRVRLRLDTSTPESHEHRRIVSTRDGLAVVTAWLDVPPWPGQPDPALMAEVLYGGRIVRLEAVGIRFKIHIQLPEPLRLGESHEYGLILRIPKGQPMRPFYLFTPECQCNMFDLRVRFSPDNLPNWIRLEHGIPTKVQEPPTPAGELISLSQAGEAHVAFEEPAMDQRYGLRWHPVS